MTFIINNKAGATWDLCFRLFHGGRAALGVRMVEDRYCQSCWVFGPLLIVLNIYLSASPLHTQRTEP